MALFFWQSDLKGDLLVEYLIVLPGDGVFAWFPGRQRLRHRLVAGGCSGAQQVVPGLAASH